MRPATTLLLLLSLAVGCTRAADPQSGIPSFGERTVVMLLADSSRMAALRADYDDEDFAVVADDMMWYRSEAWTWFEQRGIPVVSIEGRPPLSFLVDHEYRQFDFLEHETLDVVVLYDRNRAPLAVAPIDAPTSAQSYFQPPPPEP